MTTPWPRYAEAAKKEGFYLIVLWDKERKNNNALNKVYPFADELYMIDFKDVERMEALVELIHRSEPLDYIYHLGKDEHMEMAYKIAQKYNMNLNPLDAISNMNDKFKMRKHLKKKNISSIQYELANMGNIEEKVKNFNFPFIVKPTNLSGSKGVLLCEKQEDLNNWKEYLLNYDYEGDYLIEEYLVGKEVSVETLSFQGKHFIVGITDKIKTPPPIFVELGHVFPSCMDDKLKTEITMLVLDVLESFNYQFGPVHTEVIITEHGPKIVELQPRLAGDRIPILIEYSTGCSVENTIFKMLEGDSPQITKNEGISRIHYFQWKPGKVKEIKGIEKILEFSSVKQVEINIQQNDWIATLLDSTTRPGYVIVSGSSYEELESEIKKIEDTVEILYYPI